MLDKIEDVVKIYLFEGIMVEDKKVSYVQELQNYQQKRKDDRDFVLFFKHLQK